ncbi:MAG: DUF927 domain-containing protein, partial [Oscillospiraceae bacterium]|nr:DUF927 domain-containing protein [Oscillospiraceae bacterium]
TGVGHEKVAGFLRNIPLCIDEGQLKRGEKFNVYALAEGAGRTRGNKKGGIDATSKWRMCILTTGECQIASENDGEGALNRIIDIECKPEEKIFTEDEVESVITVFKQNYGHAGRIFVEALTEERVQKAQQLVSDFQRELLNGDTTGKQAMAAAMLLTADRLADEIIYHTGKSLTVKEISHFLKTKKSVSIGERGYSFMCDWVALNVAKFSADGKTDCYGIIDGDYAYINRGIFRKTCYENGFDEKALLSWMRMQGLILTRGKNMTRGKRIAGVNVECVAMRMPDCGIPADELGDLL